MIHINFTASTTAAVVEEPSKRSDAAVAPEQNMRSIHTNLPFTVKEATGHLLPETRSGQSRIFNLRKDVKPLPEV